MMEQLALDEARARNNPNAARITRNGAANGLATETAHQAAARIYRDALAAPQDQDQDQDPVNDFLNDARARETDTHQQDVLYTGRPNFTIVQQLEGCGLDVEKATAVAQDLFVNKYIACKNISETTIYHRFKRLASSTDNPVELTGGDENYILAFIFWAKERILLGEDPASTLFPPEEVGLINDRSINHKKYLAQCTRDAPGYLSLIHI